MRIAPSGRFSRLRAQARNREKRPWLCRFMERRPTEVAADANKIARMAWSRSWSAARDTRSRNCCWRHEHANRYR